MIDDTEPDNLVGLARWLQYLGIQTCVCPMAWKSLGRLYNVSMGHGWVRMSTVASCEHHGTEAVKRWEAEHRPGKRQR